jgi:hypothetical protein
MTCQHCSKYFESFSCGARSHGECDCPKCQGYCSCQSELHESGLAMERWNWPFKTAEERAIVAKYFKEFEAREKAKMLESLGQPDW